MGVNPVLIGLLAFIVLQLGIGVAVSRRIRSEEDYLLAGRSLGPGLVCLSVFATWFGAETCVSSASGLYERGLAGGAAEPFGYGLCILFYGAAFALPLWRQKVVTLADWFRERYSPGVEAFAVVILSVTSLFWASAQIRAFGQVLSASAGADVRWAITFAAGVAVAYTVLGGLRADVITDVFQGVIIIAGLLVLLVLVVRDLGGPAAAWGCVTPERLDFFPPGASLAEFLETWAVPVFGSVTAQELAARSLAARSARVARSATMAGGALYLAIGAIPAFLGLIGPAVLPGVEDSEQMLPQLARRYLPLLGYILFSGALVSAILSTVDSSLLACSALLSHNGILPRLRRRNERSSVRWARLGVIGCGVGAWILALSADSIVELVEASSSFGGAGLFVLFALGMASRRGGGWGALFVLGAAAATWIATSQIEGYPAPYLTSLGVGSTAYILTWACQRPSAPRSPTAKDAQ